MKLRKETKIADRGLIEGKIFIEGRKNYLELFRYLVQKTLVLR